MLRLGQEVGQGARVKFRLLQHAAVQQFFASWVEIAVQDGEELESVGRQNFGVSVRDGAWRAGGGLRAGILNVSQRCCA